MNSQKFSLIKLTQEINLENILNLQSLDVKKFFETQIESKINKNSTTTLIQQEIVESVVKISSFNQPKVVSKNFGSSDLLSDGGGNSSSHQSEDFFISKKDDLNNDGGINKNV